MRDAAERLERIARRSGDERVALSGRRALALFLSNYSPEQERCAELRLELRAAYERIGEPFLALELLADAADSLLRVGEIRRARPLAEEAVAIARRLQGTSAAFLTYPVLAELLLTTGELAALDELFDELAPYLGEAPSGRAIQFVGARGVADMWRGVNTLRLEETGSHGDEAVWQQMRFVGRIWACVESGAHDEAKALLDQMAPLVPFEGEGMRWILGALPLVYNYGLLGLGREAARWCGSLARQPQFQIPGGQARLVLARTHRLNGEPEMASLILTDAIAHYEREGMRPFLLEALVEQTGIEQQRGDRASAATSLSRAAQLAAELGMASWLARLRRLR